MLSRFCISQVKHFIYFLARFATTFITYKLLITITGRSTYPFMEAKAGELTVGDVERLLGIYKDVVNKYTHLSEAFRRLSLSKPEFHHLEETGGLFAQPPQTSIRKGKESIEGRGE